jgi:hypothetical protein
MQRSYPVLWRPNNGRLPPIVTWGTSPVACPSSRRPVKTPRPFSKRSPGCVQRNPGRSRKGIGRSRLSLTLNPGYVSHHCRIKLVKSAN